MSDIQIACERGGYLTAIMVALGVPAVAVWTDFSAEGRVAFAIGAWTCTLVLFFATVVHKRSGSGALRDDPTDFTARFGFSSGGPLLAALRIVLFGELWATVFMFGTPSAEFLLAAAGFTSSVLLSLRKAWEGE